MFLLHQYLLAPPVLSDCEFPEVSQPLNIAELLFKVP